LHLAHFSQLIGVVSEIELEKQVILPLEGNSATQDVPKSDSKYKAIQNKSSTSQKLRKKGEQVSTSLRVF
jgi:hypothetical protein